MRLWENLRVAWQAHKTRRKMNRVFRRGEDPYRYAHSPYELSRLSAMERVLRGRSWEHALEVGCAEGFFTERLARLAGRVTALDISPVALSRARRRVPSAQFLGADLMTWAPPAATRYDAVVLGDVLYYLDRAGVADAYAAVYPKVASWLASGGRLVLAHGFAGERELAHRRSFRERFERAGLRLVSEEIVSGAEEGGVRCLLSVLETG